jgi:aerobic-type carbon monoxide dehydrogenase small subunit (CoxS/CutS family)
MALSGRRITRVSVSVNGVYSEHEVPVRYTLAEFLREEMDLTGTKLGCNRAECGACTVLLDGKPVFSCTVLAAEADGMRVETVEGIAVKEGLHPIHAALLKHDGLQCGFCTPGIVVSLKAMLDANPNPTTDDVKKAIAGNLCRCGAYQNIFEAIARVSEAGEGPL